MKDAKPKVVNNNAFKSSFDYFGSYTGVSIDNGNAPPIQDADDL